MPKHAVRVIVLCDEDLKHLKESGRLFATADHVDYSDNPKTENGIAIILSMPDKIIEYNRRKNSCSSAQGTS